MASRFSNSAGFQLVRVRGQQQTLLAFTGMLSVDLPVIYKTGLMGKYDFTLEYARDLPGPRDGPSDPPGAPSVFTALQQQLGLQLVKTKASFDFLVIESFNRLPVEN